MSIVTLVRAFSLTLVVGTIGAQGAAAGHQRAQPVSRMGGDLVEVADLDKTWTKPGQQGVQKTSKARRCHH